MSIDEINTLLRTSYGEDLGYNSDDAEYELYKNFKAGLANHNNQTLTPKGMSFNLNKRPTETQISFHNNKSNKKNIIKKSVLF